MNSLCKIIAVITTMVGIIGMLLGKITFWKFLLMMVSCWIGLPLFVFIILPLIAGLVVALWES